MAAVQWNAYALQYASAELQADREFVLAAVQWNGYALQDASAELQADREVVLAAVRQDGLALQHAFAKLRADREIVLAAVEQNGRAFMYASVELQSVRFEVGQLLAAQSQRRNVATTGSDEGALEERGGVERVVRSLPEQVTVSLLTTTGSDEGALEERGGVERVVRSLPEQVTVSLLADFVAKQLPSLLALVSAFLLALWTSSSGFFMHIFTAAVHWFGFDPPGL